MRIHGPNEKFRLNKYSEAAQAPEQASPCIYTPDVGQERATSEADTGLSVLWHGGLTGSCSRRSQRGPRSKWWAARTATRQRMHSRSGWRRPATAHGRSVSTRRCPPAPASKLSSAAAMSPTTSSAHRSPSGTLSLRTSFANLSRLLCPSQLLPQNIYPCSHPCMESCMHTSASDKRNKLNERGMIRNCNV